jgi:diaminohydroxyphosphoribosylaminopyrimidine deaminase/5-amino-6-(5-phosphoribosylamino)uracil reductase
MDEKYMKRAIELSKKGIGYTNSNPLVGAVIVKDGKVIGEGLHEYYGGNHAEVNAILSATESVYGATMYVTLEPCSHYGKTPPCADRLVKEGISEVIVGMIDPNPEVAGRGISILEENGIKVVTGILKEEIEELNEVFIKYITKNEPFCWLKYAMTLDGKIASYTGDSRWITNEKSRAYVHEIRHRAMGIMVGIGTVIADDPMLNTRLAKKEGKDPVRIIVDSKCRIPSEAKVLNNDSDMKTIVVVTTEAKESDMNRVQRKGAEIIVASAKKGKVDIEYLFKRLGKMGIDSILIEGGGELSFSALEAGVVDKVLAFVAPKLIGGKDAATPVGGKGIEYMRDALELSDIKINMFEEDIMIEGKLKGR